MPAKRSLRAATPREIRRAFGPGALDVINDHADRLEDLSKLAAAHEGLINPDAGALCHDVRASLTRTAFLEDASHGHAKRLNHLEQTQTMFMQRSLVDRLRWLFTGQ